MERVEYSQTCSRKRYIRYKKPEAIIGEATSRLLQKYHITDDLGATEEVSNADISAPSPLTYSVLPQSG